MMVCPVFVNVGAGILISNVFVPTLVTVPKPETVMLVLGVTAIVGESA